MQDLLLKSASAEVSFVEHDDVHDISNDDIVVTNRKRSPSPLPRLIDTQTKAQLNNSEVETATTSVHDDTKVQIANDQQIQPVQISSTLGQLQEVHSNKNIKHDLELWARIRKYDQRTVDEGFTQVLTKKQKQTVKNKSWESCLIEPVQRVILLHMHNEFIILECERY